MNWTVYASVEERRAALVVAADVLEARYPQCQATARTQQGPNTLEVHAVWLWPGVVRVSDKYTGALVAQSLPGRPRELDTELVQASARRGK